MRKVALSCLALLAAACGDPLLFLEVQEKRVCIIQSGQRIEGPAAGTYYPELTAIWDGTYDLGTEVPGVDTPGVTGTLRLTEFVLTVTDGTADLSGIEEATLVATATSGATEGERTLLQLDPARSDATHLFLSGSAGANLLDDLSAGKLGYRVQVAGTPPAGSWVAEMQSCMYVKVLVDPLAM